MENKIKHIENVGGLTVGMWNKDLMLYSSGMAIAEKLNEVIDCVNEMKTKQIRPLTEKTRTQMFIKTEDEFYAKMQSLLEQQKISKEEHDALTNYVSGVFDALYMQGIEEKDLC